MKRTSVMELSVDKNAEKLKLEKKGLRNTSQMNKYGPGLNPQKGKCSHKPPRFGGDIRPLGRGGSQKA